MILWEKTYKVRTEDQEIDINVAINNDTLLNQFIT